MPEFNDLIRQDLCSYASASNLAFNEKVKALVREGRNIAHFAFGESPFPVPKCMTNALKKNAHRHEYLPMAGILSLRDELRSFHIRHDSTDLPINGFVVGPGSKELIYITMVTFNGDILIPTPAWTTYAPQTTLAGKNYIPVETDVAAGWKVTPKTLRDAINKQSSPKRNKILILTNPGNPSGTCYKAEELRILSEVCRETSTIVMSDEIYARLTFSGNHSSMLQYYPEGTILTSGFSKWASAGGWRLGYAHFPQTLSVLRDAVLSGASHTYSCAPAPMQFGVAECMKDNRVELETYMEKCRLVLKAVGDYCYRELASVGVSGNRSEACFYYMPDFETIRAGLASRGIVDGQGMAKAMMEDCDVALMSSDAFLRPKSELTTRFCFVCFDGGKILEELEGLNGNMLEKRLDKEFIEQHCRTLVGGIERLKKWVVEMKSLERN